MRRLSLPTCIGMVFGISLFSFFIRLYLPGLGQHLTLAITDVVIGLLLLYALVANRLTLRSPILGAMLFLAGVAFLSGVVNAWTDRTFDAGDFSIDYIRILGLVAMVFLLPSLLRRMGHDRLAQGTLWVVRLHALLVIADSFLMSPINWSGVGIARSELVIDYPRPRGFFVEPSFFGIYMGLSLFYILQVERNMRARYIGVFDIILVSLALIISTSISSIGVLGLFLLVLARRRGMLSKAKILMAVVVFAVSFGLLVTTFPGRGPGKNWEYFTGRFSFADTSGQQRLIGSSLLVFEVLNEAPLLGTGLGGTNVRRLLDRYWQSDSQRIVPLSTTIIPATVIATIGIIGLLPFVFIYGWMLRTRQTRLIGISLLAVAFMWGGPFEPILWWYICLAVSLKRWVPMERKKIVSGMEAIEAI